jgi:hypothetical protein
MYSNNFLWVNAFNKIKNLKPRGLNFKNFNYEEFIPSINMFYPNTETKIIVDFYLDVNTLIRDRLAYLLNSVKDCHIESLLKYIIDYNVPVKRLILLAVKLSEDKKILLKKFFKTNDFRTINQILLSSDRLCKKCGNVKNILLTWELRCRCEAVGSCMFCNEIFFSKHERTHHYNVIHNLDYSSLFIPIITEMYCIFCKEKVVCRIDSRNNVKVHKCKNKKCKDYMQRKKDRLQTFNSSIKNRENFDNSKYVAAAYKREAEFKKTILDDGLNKKAFISSKARIKQSTSIKSRILQGKFTPCVTNSWCKSKIVYKDKKFRSSWEALFYLLNEELEYETVRIPYFSNKNKQRIYIVDFFDNKTNTLFEIKPKSLKNKENNIIKEKAAQIYSNENFMNYIIVDESFLKSNIASIEDNYSKNKLNFDKDSVRKIEKTIKILKGEK